MLMIIEKLKKEIIGKWLFKLGIITINTKKYYWDYFMPKQVFEIILRKSWLINIMCL